MSDLRSIFAELGLCQYLDDFIDQGFDSWQTILDIQESDFDVLKVKLGHRRKLQRKIANSRGYSFDRALESQDSPLFDRSAEEPPKVKNDAKDPGATLGTKRKYRRHPKPDENAPERPPSAYVIFSNKMREELKGRNLSFTEIAKLVGEKWQNLSFTQKEQFEQQASTAKEKYNNELIEYKKTNMFKEYSRYLADFKARHSRQNSGETDNLKRLKLEEPPINRNGSVTSNTASQTEESSNSNSDTASSDSTPSSTTSPWSQLKVHEESPARDISKLSSTAAFGSTISPNVVKSPVTNSPTHLLKFQDVSLNSSPLSHFSSRSLPDKSSYFQQMKENEAGEIHLSPPQLLPHLQPSYQFHSQTHQLLLEKQDPVSKSPRNCSVLNRICPAPASLRILMEPSIDRTNQTPPIFTDHKIDDRFERQLPPLLPNSLSPKSQTQDTIKQDQASSKFFNHLICNSSVQIPPIRYLSDYNDRQTLKMISTSSCDNMKHDSTSVSFKS